MSTTGSFKAFTAVCLLAGFLVAAPVLAQNPTGILTGRVQDDSGAGLPGVTVTATSPNLQGSRVTQTGANGDYKVAFLPPGEYQITYELEGFKTSLRDVKISAAQTTPSDVSMELGVVSEEIVVTGQQAAISETGTNASTVTFGEIEDLPITRTLASAVNLAAGVSNSGFGSSNSPSIGGAPTFENLFMINGVTINENIRGGILDLFIEDAVQETTTAVSGVSAEYGRFSGGVVNAITKSGGNEFDGSVRINFNNEDWEGETPLTVSQEDELSEVYEGTLGGFLWKDHIWFFAAGRDFETATQRTTDITNIAYPFGQEEQRLEAKLTITPHPSHSFVGSYLEIDESTNNSDFGVILDQRSLTQREDPQEIQAINYTGILTSSFFVEAQFSDREFLIAKGSGGVPDLIDGTLIRTRGASFRYWAPTFCGFCEDQFRNNENLLGKASYFLSTENSGTHDFVFGYDTFEDSIFSVNHQTGSDFTVYANGIVGGSSNPTLDPTTGSYYPIFDPSSGSQPWIRWFAVFNSDLATPSEFKTNSFYANDRWQLNDKWSFNLGVRYDENDGTNSAGVQVATDSKVSPRLGATYDVKGDGDLVLHANYGTYVAAIASSGNIADGSSNGGAIGNYRFDYEGPAINVGCTPGVNCLSADEVLQQVFDWYTSQGGVFDLAQIDSNSPAFTTFLSQVGIPGATDQIQGGIASPSVDEIAIGATKRIGTKGLFRADLVVREWDDFYGERTDLRTGSVDTSSGPADLTLIGNFNSGVEREYIGLQTQFRYRFTDRFTLAGNYTLSNAEGNYDGETGPSGPVPAQTEVYPEYTELRWFAPVGDLRVDQKHKLRVWGVYDLLDTEHHRLNVSLLQNFFSGSPYAANANIDPSSFVANPGYNTPPTSVTYHFSAPDAFHTDDVTRTDVALNYSLVFDAFGRELELFLQPEVINLFNEDAVIDPRGLDNNEGVTVLQDFDPFNSTPVEGVDYVLDDNFGQPLNENDFQTPRTFRFSVGFRF